MTNIEKPIVLEIEKIVGEAKGFKTFIFKHKLNATPGQFVMLWLPQIDEKPFSISYQDNEKFAITVFKVGKFTEELFKLKEGDKLGVRGPYGHGFSLKGKKVVLVGGGCGTAPMGFLADELKKKRANVNFIIGAKSKEYLIFLKRMKLAGIKTLPATDNGSFGFKGFTTKLLESFLKNNKVDYVYTCGPEPMMAGVAKMCVEKNIPCEVSMERYMKCGFGICGQCCVDDSGDRICKEGPVLPAERVLQTKEFNQYKRNAAGTKQGKWNC